MRYVAAYLLAVLGGNKTPNAGDLEKILSSVGIEAEKEKVDKVLKELVGKDVKLIIEQGKQKLSSMPSGGGGGGGGGAAAPAAAKAAAAAPAAKKEEKKVEEKEESDEDMGFGLFD